MFSHTAGSMIVTLCYNFLLLGFKTGSVRFGFGLGFEFGFVLGFVLGLVLGLVLGKGLGLGLGFGLEVRS